MTPFTSITGPCVPVLEDDLNTDQIAPIQMSRELKPDYADLLFKRQRENPDGSRVEGHIFNQPRYARPAILMSRHNFGCGSSREAAVWCLTAVGIRCVVARSIADIFRENCLQNGVLPIELDDATAEALEKRVLAADGNIAFTADLPSQTIRGPGGGDVGFEISASDKMRLIEGLDDIGVTLKHDADIKAWETTAGSRLPWMQQARDKRLK
jgi:3-isopropylmalate/(R)-2-methylmalate dehydratase small subunit